MKSPDIRQVVQQVRRELAGNTSLHELAGRFRMSPFRLHRQFKTLTGEGPGAYVRRLRLISAAAELQAGSRPLYEIARRCGFRSAEVLIRAFAREFGCTPGQYRQRLSAVPSRIRARNAAQLMNDIAPCLYMYRSNSQPRKPSMPTLSLAQRQVPAQPVVFIRSRIARSAIAATIGASLGRIVPYILGHGGQMAGQPYARYPEFGPGMLTIEVGMPVVAAIAGEGDIEAASLPAGKVAVALHGGAYERLPETFAALETWMAEQKLVSTGAPWEVYVNDPADLPDSADWRTEIYWPVN
jgi:AraC-like DNA-binding protein/effector-binding domain-containing protein